MIVKPLKTPYDLLQMEALNSRLPLSHVQKEEVAKKARNLRAGYNGELSLQFPLKFLSNEKYLLFHNLRIPDAHGYFQIDILLLAANFIQIIEVKNIWNHVIFDEMGQAFRVENEKEQGFTNPVDQVKLQYLRLRRWLKQFNFPPIPIEKIVVYSNSNTILKNLANDKELIETIIHKSRLIEKINELSSKHKFNRLSENQLMELSYQLLLAHKEKSEDVLRKYGVSYEQLIKGVFCPSCSNILMQRKNRKWICPSCGMSSKLAHKAALVDYALLINIYLNNRQARDFLQLDSIHIVKRLLQNENFEQFGVKSGRKYKLDIEKLL